MVNVLSNWRFEEGTYTDTLTRSPVSQQSQSGCAKGPEPQPAKKATSYTSKHVLFNEGDDADTVYEIVDGTVMLYTISEDGRRTVFGFMQKGDYFGFVMRDVYPYFAQTVGACTIRTIPCAKLSRQIREHHRTAEKFLALEGNALEKMHRHIILLTRKTPIECVSMFLLEMAERQGDNGKYASEVLLPMTRLDIADYLGLVVETVCRCLTHLKDHGVIGKDKRGRIEIPDAAALMHYAADEGASDFLNDLLIPERMDIRETSFGALADMADGCRADLVAY